MFAASDPIAEREYCGCDHEVQRKEEERVLPAQPDRNSEGGNAQERDRDRRRVTRQWNRGENRCDNSYADEPDAGRLREQESKVVIADERAPDARRRKAKERESHKGEKTSARDEQEHGAERTHERGNVSGVRVLHDAGRYVFAG